MFLEVKSDDFDRQTVPLAYKVYLFLSQTLDGTLRVTM